MSTNHGVLNSRATEQYISLKTNNKFDDFNIPDGKRQRAAYTKHRVYAHVKFEATKVNKIGIIERNDAEEDMSIKEKNIHTKNICVRPILYA